MAYSALRPSSTTAARKRKAGADTPCHDQKKRSRNREDAANCPRPHPRPEDGNASAQDKGAAVSDKEGAGLETEETEVRVKYGDFRLFLVIDDASEQIRLGIQPQYKHYKGEKRRKQLKTFTYWTLPYVLACPAATLLALALHDGALQDIRSIDDLLRLRVPAGTDQIELYWSFDWYERCILRESSPGETMRELSSAKARYRFGRLGENMGLQQRFVAYCLRRFCLNLLSIKAGQQVRRHVAGHTNEDIYENHYIYQRMKVTLPARYWAILPRTGSLRDFTE